MLAALDAASPLHHLVVVAAAEPARLAQVAERFWADHDELRATLDRLRPGS